MSKLSKSVKKTNICLTLNMLRLLFCGLVGVLCLAAFSHTVEADVVINEILADPAVDMNGDGLFSSSADEYIELLNAGASTVNISGWTLTDAVKIRHVVPFNTFLAPSMYMVIFGGGTAVLPGIHAQKASTGSLGLNNSGDVIGLFNAHSQQMDEVTYGSIGNHDRSFGRNPEGVGVEFFLLDDPTPGRGDFEGFSDGAGTPLDQELTPDSAAVPEFPVHLYFGMGTVWMTLCRHWPGYRL